MKRVFSIITFVALAIVFTNAQSTTKGPIMTLETEEIDYGTIDQNSEPLRVFKFKNTGGKDLVITNAKGSCGCTVPNWPKEPIKPGASGAIEVRYDTNRVGAFSKSVTINTNEEGDAATKILRIKGTVNKKEEAPGVPGTSNSFNNNN